MIQGLETSYDGVGPQANRGLQYLNPFLSTSRRVFGELNADQRTFENLIVDSSHLSGALAASAPRHLGPGRKPRPDDERDRRPQGARSRSRSRCSRTSCATRTRRSSTCARRSTTSTRWSTPRSPPRASCARSSPPCARPPPTPCPRSATSTRSCAVPGATTTWSSSPAAADAGAARGGLGLARLRQGPRRSGRPPDGRRRRLQPGRLRRVGVRAAQRRPDARLLPRLHARARRLVRRLRPLRLGRRARRHRPRRNDVQRLQRLGPGRHPGHHQAAERERAGARRSTRATPQRCPGANERPVNDIDPSDDSVPFTDGGALTDGVPATATRVRCCPAREADRPHPAP